MPELPKFNISGGWKPDYLPYKMPEGGCQIVKNLIPFTDHYVKMPTGVEMTSNGVSGTVLNSYIVRRGSVLYTYIGTTTGLYRLESDHTVTNLSRPTAYSTASGETWSYALFGDWLIATNYSDEMQVLKAATKTQAAVTSITSVGTTATVTTTAAHGLSNNDNVLISGATETEYNGRYTITSTGANTFTYTFAGSATSPATGTILWERAFQNLAGTPPKARYITNVKGCIIAGYLYESSTTYPRRVRWSALENPESWTASATTMSGFQTIADMDGTIKGLGRIGTDSAAIFSEDAITTMFFIGSPYIFRFQNNVVKGYGLISSGALTEVNNGIIYWSSDDIYIFDGNNSVSLGDGIRKSQLENIDLENSHKIWNAHDPINTMIYTTVPSLAQTDDAPDRVVCHNYGKGKFTYIEGSYPAICFLSPILTMDDLTFLGYADDIIELIDSRIFTRLGTCLGYVDKTSGKVGIFLGMPKTGLIHSAEMYTGNRLMISGVKPLCNRAASGAVSCRIGHRENVSDEVSYTAVSTANRDGYCDVLAAGKLLSVEVSLGRHYGIADIEVQLAELGAF